MKKSLLIATLISVSCSFNVHAGTAKTLTKDNIHPPVKKTSPRLYEKRLLTEEQSRTRKITPSAPIKKNATTQKLIDKLVKSGKYIFRNGELYPTQKLLDSIPVKNQDL